METREEDENIINTGKINPIPDPVRSQKTTIYCFPGLGSDRRIFELLTIDPRFELKFIEYGTPDEHLTLHAFARLLAQQIDRSKEFILLGVSLGGIICCELSEMLQPLKTIIISSAKNRKELPLRYRFMTKIPLYKIFPGSFLKAGARILQPLFEPDRKKNNIAFKSMLEDKNEIYIKRTIQLIIDWDRTGNTQKIYHIHGTRDRTLPFKKIAHPVYPVENGSHVITLTRAKEVSDILNEILTRE
jgi:pimeloyl-ACP methyl ester carboxylesterase